MKGIVLAGGSGTRLYPLTQGVSKQLLPIYSKPMIYYPISTLMLAGIQDILLISTPTALPAYQRLLGNGQQFGINISYLTQQKPNGVAEAFIIGRDFISGEQCCLVLGDNVFWGENLKESLQKVEKAQKGATIFGHVVENPEFFGVVEIAENGTILSIEEKPKRPKSNYAITGLYFYDEMVCDYAEMLRPSKRGELEITDLNRIYLEAGTLSLSLLNEQTVWFDTGTIDQLMKSAEFVRYLECECQIGVAVLEEIAYQNGWVDQLSLRDAVHLYGASQYGQYLQGLLERLKV